MTFNIDVESIKKIFDEDFVRISILIMLWVWFTWESFLIILQCYKAVRTKEIPILLQNMMNTAEFEISKAYSLAQLYLELIKGLFQMIVISIIIYHGFLGYLWDFAKILNAKSYNILQDELAVSCIWLILLSLLALVLEIPFLMYYKFVIEEHFGFNNEGFKQFIVDTTKQFILSEISLLVLAVITVLIVREGGSYFFLWFCLFLVILVILLLTLVPTVLAPMFFKFKPLPEGELRNQIESLAAQQKFPLTQIYVMETSKQTKHTNAFFFGIGRTKRIVLFDTILPQADGTGFKIDEIVAVVCHEMGHWKYNHTIVFLIITVIDKFILLIAFCFMYKHRPLYQALGFYSDQPVLVGFIAIINFVMMPFNVFMGCFLNCISRKCEYKADKFAVSLGRSDAMKRALIKIHKENLEYPVTNSLYECWNYTHPSLLRRLKRLQELS